MSMNILCVIDSLGSGGAQRQLVNIACELKERGHCITFLVYHSDPFFNQSLEQQSIEVIEVIEPNYFKRLLKMRNKIRSGGYDAVLSFLEAASFICEVSSFPYRKWRLIVSERSANPAILKSFKLRFFRWFHLLADAVVANSYENLKLVKRVNPLLSDQKLNVVYNLIDFDKWRFQPDNYIYNQADKFNLTVVASHQYLKNLNGLVEAVNLLNENEKKKLIINWYGGERLDDSKETALNKIKSFNLVNNFKFHQPTSDIVSEVNKADCVGLFSFYEGLPNVVCEAMANAKPVIASNVSDVGLLLEKDFIFNPNHIDEIVIVLKYILAQDRLSLREVGEKNLQKANLLFNKEFILSGYLALLSGCVINKTNR